MQTVAGRLETTHAASGGLLLYDFPLTGAVAEAASRFTETLPAPWRGHARCAIASTSLVGARLALIGVLDQRLELTAGVWLSLPDRAVVGWTPKPAAYICHVYVAPEMRRRRLAFSVCDLACRVAANAGADRVLLAAADSKLREGLYGALGFRPFPNSPFLMEKEVDHGCRLDSRRLFHIRAVGPFDLATVQSICAGGHWLGMNDQWELIAGAEAEEEFCELFGEPGEASKQSYVAVGKIGDSPFVSWFARGTTEWQRLSFCGDNLTATDAARAGRLVREAFELLRAPSASSHSVRTLLCG